MKTLLFILLIPGLHGNAQQLQGNARRVQDKAQHIQGNPQGVKGNAQTGECSFPTASLTMDFGSGLVEDLNANGSYAYRRIMGSCPSDGHYTYASSTSDCFRGDWQTLASDHTGNGGNMMIVNASYRNGYFLTTRVKTLKPGTIYEFGVWMLNVCKLSDKCPFPLLPNITIQLRTLSGVVVGQLETGEVARLIDPKWSQYKFVFTTPASGDELILTMIDNIPGGCGNDFALDDITFSECVKIPPVVARKTVLKKTSVSKTPVKKTIANKPTENKTIANKTTADKTTANKTATEKTSADKPVTVNTATANKTSPPNTPTATRTNTAKSTIKPNAKSSDNVSTKADSKPTTKPVVTKAAPKPDTARSAGPSASSVAILKPAIPAITDRPVVKERPKLAPPPPAIARRENEVYKNISTAAGEIRIDLYDNGEIDGDTVTIYHNNKLVVSRAKLSAQPITLRIAMNPDDPYHEIVMVANNLGSIPPNTSLMIVNAGGTRYEVYTSSNEKKNAKVIFSLKE